MSEAEEFRYTEEDIPLEGIATSVEEVVVMYGGKVLGASSGRIDFALPRRRGVAASGYVKATLEWSEPDGEGYGDVSATTGEELMANRGQRIALLAAGVIGATLFILWPYFPQAGALAWIGGAIAIATYLLTLKKTQHGTVYAILMRISDMQRERLIESNELSSQR